MCFYVTMWFKKMKQMKRILKITTVAVLILSAAACSNESTFDASGSFEAVEIIISSEATGTLKEFAVEEGQTLQSGQYIAKIYRRVGVKISIFPAKVVEKSYFLSSIFGFV